MAILEIKQDTLSEIKILAKDFLDRSREDIDHAVKNPEYLEIIGLRMVETLFRKSTRNTFGV